MSWKLSNIFSSLEYKHYMFLKTYSRIFPWNHPSFFVPQMQQKPRVIKSSVARQAPVQQLCNYHGHCSKVLGLLLCSLFLSLDCPVIVMSPWQSSHAFNLGRVVSFCFFAISFLWYCVLFKFFVVSQNFWFPHGPLCLPDI